MHYLANRGLQLLKRLPNAKQHQPRWKGVFVDIVPKICALWRMARLCSSKPTFKSRKSPSLGMPVNNLIHLSAGFMSVWLFWLLKVCKALHSGGLALLWKLCLCNTFTCASYLRLLQASREWRDMCALDTRRHGIGDVHQTRKKTLAKNIPFTSLQEQGYCSREDHADNAKMQKWVMLPFYRQGTEAESDWLSWRHPHKWQLGRDLRCFFTQSNSTLFFSSVGTKIDLQYPGSFIHFPTTTLRGRSRDSGWPPETPSKLPWQKRESKFSLQEHNLLALYITSKYSDLLFFLFSLTCFFLKKKKYTTKFSELQSLAHS